MTRQYRARITTLAAALACAMLATGCSVTAADSDQLNLVAYSTPQEAYHELVGEFGDSTAGKGSTIHQSFGASGAQSRAVAAGQPADIVELSMQPDMTRLVSAGVVAKDWNSGKYHGMVTDSVVVFIVRKGNPKHITGWDDLTGPGVEVVTPNPFSSGSAQWNLMAAYGAQLKQGRSPAQALDYVGTLLRHTVAQPESGSKATAAFTAGTGDVLISYENEAIEAQQAHQHVDFVTPAQTLLIENPVAVTSTSQHPKLAAAFVKFLYTTTAQRAFARHGYRPVLPSARDTDRFPTPRTLFTIDDLGGWSKVSTKFFDPKTGLISKIEKQVGVGGG